MKRKLGLLPTPVANVNRKSRRAMTGITQWSAPGLEQVAELVSGELPREFGSENEIPGASRKLLPTPKASDERRAGGIDHGEGGPSLPGAMALLPTPTSQGGGKGGTDFARAEREGSGGDDLGTTMVKLGLEAEEEALTALLPTPQASDGSGGRFDRSASENGWRRPSGARATKTLGTAARLLPTPNASLANYTEEPEAWALRSKHNQENRNGVGESSLPLPVALKRTGGPTAPPSSDGASSSAGLRLSPSFVEWLMGAPDRWTDPGCLLSATEFSSRPAGSSESE